jgi:ASC-1-like (ASCH) protein
MKHEMKLNSTAFGGVKKGIQKYETRLLDEKRSKIQIGDTIIFYKLPDLKEKTEVKVTNIIRAKNFNELFTMFPVTEANWPSNFTIEDCAKSMEKYYSIKDQNKYGVVAFKLLIS